MSQLPVSLILTFMWLATLNHLACVKLAGEDIMHATLLNLVILVTCVFGGGTHTDKVQLNSTLVNRTAYRGDNINFTCITRGSSSLVWTSNDYIGPDGERVEFHSISTPRVTPNPYTTLELLSKGSENGETVITSQLRIIVQRGSNYSSVTCLSTGTDQEQTITFNFTSAPSIEPPGVHESEVCPNDFRVLTLTCETRESNALAWISELFIGQGGTRLEFRSIDVVGTVRNSDIHQLANVSANLMKKSFSNNVRALRSQLTVQLPSVVHSDFLSNVTCLNVGLNVGISISIRIRANCDTHDNMLPTTTSNSPGEGQGVSDNTNQNLFIEKSFGVGVYSDIPVMTISTISVLILARFGGQ